MFKAIAGLLLASACLAQTTQQTGGEVVLPSCVVSVIEDVDVPAQVAGVLLPKVPILDSNGQFVLQDGQPAYKQLRIHEGVQVTEGQILALVDDAQAWKTWEAAQARRLAAEAEASNDISVRAAKAAVDVAAAEVEQAYEANRRAPGAVAQAELRRMLLQKRQLELQKEQAEHELSIAKLSAKIRQAEEASALVELYRHQIRAPLSGVIVERYCEYGEWVQPGNPVFRIVRMDRMRVKGFVRVNEALPGELFGQPVTVTLDGEQLPPQARRLAEIPFSGQVVFVSPIVEEGGVFQIWAEVDNKQLNGQWILRDGLTASMRIPRKKLTSIARNTSER